jgi:hypothetical protein
MTVNELIEILESWPDKDDQVFLSADSEGYQFNSIDEVSFGWMSEDGQYLRDSEDPAETTDVPVLLIFPQ